VIRVGIRRIPVLGSWMVLIGIQRIQAGFQPFFCRLFLSTRHLSGLEPASVQKARLILWYLRRVTRQV
jgi:hypothetical protein